MKIRYTPILARTTPVTRFQVSLSLNNSTPNNATNTTAPTRIIGITVDTPGPLERALKVNVVKIEISTPPMIAYIVPLGFFSRVLLKTKNKIMAVVKDPAWKIRLLKNGSLRLEPSFLKRSEVAPAVIAPSA